MKYTAILADPPWRFKNYNDETATRWVGKHYPLLKLQDIANLPVYKITNKNAVLFLWATFPTLPNALYVLGKWGFTYKTVAFVWIKLNQNGSIFKGMGYWTRSNRKFAY